MINLTCGMIVQFNVSVVCDEEESTIFCPTCNQNLCEECSTFIHKKNKKSHIEGFLKPKLKNTSHDCPEHQSSFVALCLDCKTLVCLYCVNQSNHVGHEVKTLDKSTKEMHQFNEELSSNLSECVEKIKISFKFMSDEELLLKSVFERILKKETQLKTLYGDKKQKLDLILSNKQSMDDVSLFLEMKSILYFSKELSKERKVNIERYLSLLEMELNQMFNNIPLDLHSSFLDLRGLKILN
jgi:hypothetical protein